MCGIQMARNKGGDSVDAQKGLRRYAALRLENENRLEQLARLRAEAELPAQREADGSAHTGSSGERMARAIERYMEYEQQIRPIIEANQREMDAVRAAVEMLTDPMEREVLRLRYLDTNGCRLMRWRDISLILYGNDDEGFIRACMRLHKRAIDDIQIVQNVTVCH